MSYLKIAESTKQYKEAEKLVRIVEAIAKCQNRVNDRKHIIGLGENISYPLKAYPADVDYIARYYAIGLRLKLYYNNCLAKMTAFKIVTNEAVA